jgi:hypothetical protein
MSDGSVYVTFGGDTSQLEVAAANAKASVNSLTRELGTLARQQAQAGASADSDIKAKMLEVARSLDQARAGFAQSQAAMREHTQSAAQAGEGLSTLRERVDGIRSAFVDLAAVAGVALSADAFKSWVTASTDAAAKVRGDAAKLGVSTDEVQQLQGLSTLTGVDYGGLRDKLESLQLTLAGGGDKADKATAALKAFGIAAEDLKGKPVVDQLSTMADAFSKFADGPTKAAAAAELGMAELIPFLDRGRKGIQDLSDAMTRSSSLMSGDMINAIAATRDHINELSLAWNATGKIFAIINPAVDAAVLAMTRLIESIDVDKVRPALTALSQHLVDLGATVAEFAVNASASWNSFVSSITGSVGAITGAISTIEGYLRKISDFGQIPAQMSFDLQESKARFWQRMGVISPEQAQSYIDEARKGLTAASGEGADAFGGLDKAGIQLQFTLQGIADKAKTAKSALADWFTPKGNVALLGEYAGSGGAVSAPKPQVPVMDTGGGKAAAGTQGQDAQAALRQALATAQATFDETKTSLDTLLAAHKIGMAQWSVDTEAALDKEADAVQDAYAKILANAALTSAKKVEIAAQETKQLQAIWDQQAEANKKLVDEMQRNYEGVAGTISGAFTSQFDKILQGQESWSAAMKNIAKELTLDLINESIKSTAKWVADQAAQAVAAQTKAAAVNAADASAGAGGLLSQLGGALRAIETYAAEAFGGVFAFLAPVLGPAAAGPAAAASGAVMAAGSVASADIGMWQVPSDQLALVHHNELIMPAAQAGAFRSMLSGEGGAGGGGNVSVNPQSHIHVQALDAAGVASFWRNNRSDVAKHLHQAARDGAFLGMRRARLA